MSIPNTGSTVLMVAEAISINYSSKGFYMMLVNTVFQTHSLRNGINCQKM